MTHVTEKKDGVWLVVVLNTMLCPNALRPNPKNPKLAFEVTRLNAHCNGFAPREFPGRNDSRAEPCICCKFQDQAPSFPIFDFDFKKHF